jgi:hypothetical protein
MSSAEKAKFKREKTSGKRIDYNHKRREFGGENWLDQFDVGGEKSFWDKYKYLPSSKSPNTYEKVNVDKDHYAFNSSLGNKGDLKVQQYQKWLNENFNTYLDEDGIWGEKTENAYKKYVLEKQKPNIPNTDPGLLNNYDSKLSFKYDDKGNLQVKSGNKYEEDYQDWTNVEKLSPTLKEFKSLVDKIPSYNQYYEDVYDADPSLRGNQAGPVTQTRALQIENTKKYKPISDKNKEYIGKTFGTLPVVEVSGIYEGYSPNRIWTTPPATDSKPWLGDNEKYDPEKNPRYLYFITPKEGTKSADKKFTEQLEDLNCASGVCGDEYLNKSKTTYFDDISNQRFKKALKVKETIPGPTGETWKLGQQAYIEMLNNPEIIEYAKQKNIDLKNLSPKEAYSPLLAEALVANRDARFNNKDVVIPDSRYYSTVIQNPDAFNLAGYLPITLDMFSPNTDIQAQQKLLLNWDKASRESYLEKAGIPKDKWNDVYIHTSSFPIEEYTPGKKYGGWLSKYQDGSQVPFSDSSNYSYDKDGNLIYTADWRNYTNDIITNNIYSLINNPTKENSVIKKGFFRQGQPNSKSRDLNNDEIEFLKRTLQQFEDPEADFKGDVSTKVDKLNPSLDELIKVTQNIYPDQYAIDNSFLKASKSDSKINLPISAFENDIKERYVIPEVLKNSINKSFGTLPTTQEEGYSPNRIWTTKVKNNEKSGVGAGFTKPGDYAYVLTPNSKEISGLSKDQIDNQKKITERSLSSINDEFYKNLYDEGRGFVQYPGDYNNPDISLYGNLTQYLPNQIWNRAEQMRVEMMNNPEIKAWSDLHNINLLRDTSNEINKNDLTDDGFAVKVPESMYANRLVKAGLPVSTPDYNYGDNDTYIAQDPSKFNLAGYFPIPEGYNDENAKELIAKKLGIKPEQLNSKDYLIHYNKTPITEYTPGKKYGGWLSKYQSGGLSMGDYDLTTAPKRGDYLLPDINRPSYIDEAGNKRSEYRMGKNIDGRETLIPTVVGGKQLSEDEALDRYYKTGLHMGQFNTPEEADYASRLRTARYNMLEDPIRFQADQFQRGGTLPPIYTSNPRRVQVYQDSLNLYNKYQPSFDKYKNFTRVNNIETTSLRGNDLLNQYWGPYKPKGPSPYNEHIIIKPVEEMMHQYIRFRPDKSFSVFNEKPGNNYLEAKPNDYLKPNGRETRLFYAVGNDGKHLPYNVGITPAQKRINAARRSKTWPVSVTKQDFLDLGLTGVTTDLNSVFRFKKPVQPYIYRKPEVTPEVVETPVPVVEPPKPSLFVSNIDRDMYTPGGGMGREYNIGVTLQDGSKKAFRTEKEYQDWKAANNLDISNAKVTEGKGYSYDYPENKKYGGWLDQFQTGGWANFVPASSTPLLRKDVSGNAGYRDNTRVNTINPATKKAAEAAQYARRVGSISQGKTKSDYEKAREASSFVSQAEQRKGSADPLDYVLDIVNPATYGFAGTDLVGNTAMGVNNLAKGNFSEAAGNALNAGMNALYLLPAKGLAKTIASPMAFTPIEGMMYRGIGKEGFKDAVQSGVFRPKQLNYSPGRSLAERVATPKQFSRTYYAPAKKFGVVENYGPEYLAEVSFENNPFGKRYGRKDWSWSTSKEIPINEGRILKKDWLRGYKPVDVSSLQSISKPKNYFDEFDNLTYEGTTDLYESIPHPYYKGPVQEAVDLWQDYKYVSPELENAFTINTKSSVPVTRYLKEKPQFDEEGYLISKGPTSFAVGPGNKNFGENRIFLNIPENTRVAPISKGASNTNFQRERELLLPSNTKYRKVNSRINPETGLEDYYMEIVPKKQGGQTNWLNKYK